MRTVSHTHHIGESSLSLQRESKICFRALTCQGSRQMWQGRGRCGCVKEGKNRGSECLPPSMSELKPGPRPRAWL